MRVIKWILFVMSIICFLSFAYLYKDLNILKQTDYDIILKELNVAETESVIEYHTYGTHLNIRGNFDESSSIILKSRDNELEYNLYKKNDYRETSEYLNTGIDLETINTGKYYVFLKTIDKYYKLENKTEYPSIEYYTITRNNSNNKINIYFDDTMRITVKEELLPEEYYDIVIDPGHGSDMEGAYNKTYGYKESTLNLDNSKLLKQKLEQAGLKVKLTRENDKNTAYYGVNSRTGIPYEVKAKFMVSMHMNSSNTSMGNGGIEIYAANGDDYTFPRITAKKVVDNTNSQYSPNPLHKIENGVYMRTFSNEDIKDSTKTANKKGYVPYNLNTSMTYYFFIREVGGYMTQAFSDGRTEYPENPYRNYNQGIESYLIELGYINSNTNVKDIVNNKDKYMEAVKDGILEYLNLNTKIEE